MFIVTLEIQDCVNISSLLKILMVLHLRNPQIHSFFKFFTSTEIVSYHFSDLFILMVHKIDYPLLNPGTWVFKLFLLRANSLFLV